jgi:hypothetical protein
MVVLAFHTGIRQNYQIQFDDEHIRRRWGVAIREGLQACIDRASTPPLAKASSMVVAERGAMICFTLIILLGIDSCAIKDQLTLADTRREITTIYDACGADIVKAYNLMLERAARDANDLSVNQTYHSMQPEVWGVEAYALMTACVETAEKLFSQYDFSFAFSRYADQHIEDKTYIHAWRMTVRGEMFERDALSIELVYSPEPEADIRTLSGEPGWYYDDYYGGTTLPPPR